MGKVRIILKMLHQYRMSQTATLNNINTWTIMKSDLQYRF